MVYVPQVTKPPKIERVYNRDWLEGLYTANDDGRTPKNGLRDGGNLILSQDGTIGPRGSLVPYGPEFPGTLLGETFEFTTEVLGTRQFWMCGLFNVAGAVKLYTAKGEDAVWVERDGKTFSTSAYATYLQIDNKVLIMTPSDYSSYLDTVTMDVVPWVALDDPDALTLDTLTGLTGANFKVYYGTTSNSTVGETAVSIALVVDVLEDRDLWDPDTQSAKLARTLVTNEDSWNVYAGIAADGAGQPKLYRIAAGLDPSLTAFTDNGIRPLDLTSPAPLDNSTQGHKVSRGSVVNGRPFLVGDPDNPWNIYRGGDFGHELNFSPAYGGGYTPVGSGTKDKPVSIIPYPTGKGDPSVMIIQQGTNGTGRRSFYSPETVTYGLSSFIVWRVTEDGGSDGTDSPNAVIVYNNNVWYPSRDGFKTTGTKPQLQNRLSTDKFTKAIKDKLMQLNTAVMDKAVGAAFEDKLYFSLPVSSISNSEIWICDLERQGAWTTWQVPADWLFLYNDNNGKSHFLAVVNNALYEFSYSSKTSDDGTPFVTNGVSGQVRFSEDGREWGRLIQVIMTLQRPQGRINGYVTGMTDDGLQSWSQSEVYAGGSTQAGWSEPKAGWSSRGWSKIKAVPRSFNSSVEELIVEVDEDVQWYQYSWNTTDSGVDYSLSEVIGEYVNVGIKDLT